VGYAPALGRGSLSLAKVHRGLSTADDLHLDLSRADVATKLGPPSRVGKNWFERACCAKRPMTEAEQANTHATTADAFWDVCSVFRTVQVEGKVAGLAVTWTETY
jgi:hypothetical protein